jgi:hypothetical protein
MTAKTDLLPLPEWMSNYTIPADSFDCGEQAVLIDRMHDYARANVEHHTAALQAEIERLREVQADLKRKDAEIARLRAQLEYTDRYAIDSIRTASRDLDDWRGDMLHLSNSARAVLAKENE